MQKHQVSQQSAITDYTVAFPTTYSVAFPALAFLIPLVLSGPQLVVGVAVNCFLLLSASTFSRKMLLPIAILPSIGAVFHGIVLGSLTPYLLYFLPAIWIGNFLFMTTWQDLVSKGIVFSLILSSIVKAMWLSLFAFAFVSFRLVPQPFLLAMSVVQLATALIGGSFASVITHYTRFTQDCSVSGPI